MENQDTPKDILIAYYNEINDDMRLENISGRYNKESILNLLENIIDQLEEETTRCQFKKPGVLWVINPNGQLRIW